MHLPPPPPPHPDPDLVDAIMSRHAIAFVGSGLSRPNAPSWSELLYELVAAAEALHLSHAALSAVVDCIAHGSLVTAASQLAKVLPHHELSSAIIRSITFSRQAKPVPPERRTKKVPPRLIETVEPPLRRDHRPTESQRILLRLNLKAIITTNYDYLLESALGPDKIASYSHSSFTSALPIQPWRQFILHLHGDIRHQADIVFSAGDYARVGNLPAFQYVESLLDTSPTLWTGYSYTDPDLALLMAKHRQFTDHFAILLSSQTEMIQTCNSWGIRTIQLDTYEQLPDFLRKLAKMTRAQPHVVIPHSASEVSTLDPDVLNPIGRTVTDRFLSGPLAALPKNPVDPEVIVRAKGRQFDPDELFGGWTGEFARKTAIIAPPAAGKTVLLRRFAQWLRCRLDGKEMPAHRLSPIILFLGPDNLPDPIAPDRPFWRQAERWAQGPAAGYHLTETPDLLTPWLNEGKVYLLFDGLDEFGASRKGDLDELLSQMSSLVCRYGIKVFLTCREVFWSQQVTIPDKNSWEEIGISPFTACDLESLVPYPGLGQFAYGPDHKPKGGVLNRMVVSFVVALNAHGNSAEEFESRFRLYFEWVHLIVQDYRKRLGSEMPSKDWLAMFKDTALYLLKNRAVSAPPPRLADGRTVSFSQIAATGVLMPSADGKGVKFYHESINEFFVAWVLLESFQRLLDPSADEHVLAQLPLAQVDLDFLQTSLHGFLNEQLGKKYIREVLARVTCPRVLPCDDRIVGLIRNIVEYVGITFNDVNNTHAVAEWLLDLMGMRELDVVIRYNAARALERIHPWAPQPYFDYMSDWNDRDWSQTRGRAEAEGLCPWAVRGYRIKKDKETGDEKIEDRKPGQKPYVAVLRDRILDVDHQASVSRSIGQLVIETLEQLPNSSPRGGASKWRPLDLLLINYAYAWVRWYHPADWALLERARQVAEKNDAGKETLENLYKWVNHAGFRCVEGYHVSI
jgi:hypothetical protein